MNVEDEVRRVMRSRAEHVKAAPDAWDKIAEARTAPERSTRSRVLAALVAAVVALAGLAFIATAFNRDGPSPAPQTGASDGFGFPPTNGWYEIATDGLAAGDTANVAWSSTVPFTEEDLAFAHEGDGVLGRWTEPDQTVEELSADDAVVVVMASTYGEPYPAQPNANFPASDSIRLPASPEFVTEWEGHGDTGVSRVTSLATVNGWGVEVHAFFGTDDPSDAVVDAVNAQLAAFGLRTPSQDLGATNMVAITCEGDRTRVPRTAVVTPQGPRFTVDNQSGAAQVLIAGVSGDARQNAADIDLSQSTTHTFDIPPGDYVIGCFQDRVEGPGGADAWSGLPGMMPVSILDPAGTYVLSSLNCDGQAADSNFVGFRDVPAGSAPQEAIKASIHGIDDTDAIEATGYPGNEGNLGPGRGLLQYRLVRDGATLALFTVAAGSDGNPVVIDVTACEGSGIEARQPSGASPSPTQAGG